MVSPRLAKTERLATLLGAGANVNACDAKGANPNLTDVQGRTASDRCAEAGYLAHSRVLVKNGTSVPNPAAFLAKARNPGLRHEISQGSVETAKALLDEGADPSFREDDGAAGGSSA
ncbi:MAG TPA: ankyrin repeat domain-containing protein [Bryobacteraceae bacterium]|jgi:ankyrin repeat protein|nr:ankyrin repeat domain-containing protein [Bryobacteraceae bacterium]HEX4311390.1 ankyrin repeat domain-containing protein [Acidobacteriaceae bacterium]